jgi:hypothetical protein
MGRISKTLSLFLTLTIALSCLTLIVVKPAIAQTAPKPSVPTFTVTLQNDIVVLTIENQPFDVHNSYNNSFFYDVRIWNIAGYWSNLYAAEERPTQSDSSQTILYYPIGESNVFPSYTTVAGVIIPTYGQVEFQVMALIGYMQRTANSYGLVGQVSGWSSQTITLPPTNASSPALYFSPEGRMGTSYKLTMFNPNDQIIYNDTLPLDFILTWTYDLIPFGALKADYAYSIDDKASISIVPNRSSNDRPLGGSDFVYNPSFSRLLDISKLPNGYHNVVIKATFYNGQILFLNASSTPIQFIARTPTPTPKPAITPPPTLTPTPSPTSTSLPTPTPSVPEFSWLMILALFAVVLACVVSVRLRNRVNKNTK